LNRIAGPKKKAGVLKTPAFLISGYFYGQPANCRLFVIATAVNGPDPVNANGGFEFTSVALQASVVIPSTA
jgi:hypothetical protein